MARDKIRKKVGLQERRIREIIFMKLMKDYVASKVVLCTSRACSSIARAEHARAPRARGASSKGCSSMVRLSARACSSILVVEENQLVSRIPRTFVKAQNLYRDFAPHNHHLTTGSTHLLDLSSRKPPASHLATAMSSIASAGGSTQMSGESSLESASASEGPMPGISQDFREQLSGRWGNNISI